MSYGSLENYLSDISGNSFNVQLGAPAYCVTILNRNNKSFVLKLADLKQSLEDIRDNLEDFAGHEDYVESEWRTLTENYLTSSDARTLAKTQTKPFFEALNKIISYSAHRDGYIENNIPLDIQSLNRSVEILNQIVQREFHYQDQSGNTTLVGKNVIIYGAPGTGKSFSLRGLPNKIRTVFHSEYQNSDFVGSYRPCMDGTNIVYKFVPGPFIEAYVEAKKDPNQMFNLIIEEINRGNCASIFGDIFQLLDREENGVSTYSIRPESSLRNYLTEELGVNVGELRIPSNLNLYATMNSADQGVEPVDSAFKRRWEFEYKSIDFDTNDEDKRYLNERVINCNGLLISYKVLATSINDLLMSLEEMEEDKLIGQFFLNKAELSSLEAARDSITGKLFLYLWDDVLRHSDRALIFDLDTCKTYADVVRGFRQGDNVFSNNLYEKLNERARDVGEVEIAQEQETEQE